MDHSPSHNPDREERFAAELEAADERLAADPNLNLDSPHSTEINRGDLSRAADVLRLLHRVANQDPRTDRKIDDDSAVLDDTYYSGSARTPKRDGAGGTQIGDYVIEDQIASGGMGIVFRARDTKLNRLVALKMMIAGPFAHADERERFRGEAEAAAALDHPGIVPVYDVGDHAGQLYFTMGFVEGESLAERIRNEPLDFSFAVEVTAKIAAAVEYAHRQGVIHRDIKPANVLLDTADQPRITDFGLARRSESGSNLTGTEQVLGTPSYMAPEQAAGKSSSAGPLADVYSIGATLYCALTGRPPFQASSAIETLKLVVEREPVPPRQLNPNIPVDLNTICLTCLQKEPQRRYASSEALQADLNRFLEGRPILARPIGLAERTWKWSRRHPLVAGLSTAVTLSLLAIIVGGLWYQTRLSNTVGQLKQSRSEAVAQFYSTLTREAAFLNEVQPIGFGARVTELVGKAGQLDTPQKDPEQLRQLLISSLGQVGARAPLSFPEVESLVTAANVTADSRFLLLGLESGKLLVCSTSDATTLASSDALSDPVIRIDVDLDSGEPGLRSIRTISRFGKQTAYWELRGNDLKLQELIERNDTDFLGIEPTPDGKLLIGVQPVNQTYETAERWVTRSTGVFDSQWEISLRDRPGPTPQFAVASLNDPGQPARRTGIAATPRFAVSDHYLAVGYSWLDGGENKNTVTVYDHRTGEVDVEIDPSGGTLLNLAISHNGYYIACTGEHAVEVFFRPTGERVAGWRSNGSVFVDSFLGGTSFPNDLLARNQSESTWYSLDQRHPVARFPHGGSEVVQFSSDGRYSIWTRTRQPRMVDMWGKESLRIRVDGRMGTWVSFSPDAKLLIATGEYSEDRALATVCDVESGTRLFQMSGVRSTFGSEGQWIANWSQGELRLWDVASGSSSARVSCGYFPTSIAFSQRGNLVAASGPFPGNLTAWRVVAGDIPEHDHITREAKLEEVFTDPNGAGPMAISPSGSRIAYMMGTSIRTYDRNQKTETSTIQIPGRLNENTLAFLDDDHLLVLAAGQLQRWNVTTGEREASSSEELQPPLALSPDAKHVVCSRKIVRIDDLMTVLELPSQSDRLWHSAWSADGRRLAFAIDGGQVSLWDLQAVDERLRDSSLLTSQLEFAELPEIAAFGPMLRLGQKVATDSDEPKQWNRRYASLMERLERDGTDRDAWLLELNWLCEHFDHRRWRPFIDVTPTDWHRDWLNKIDRGYNLARKLQSIKEYDSQGQLLDSMQLSYEHIESPTPQMKRKISLIYHTSGDLHNFTKQDSESCLAFYREEERLLTEIIDGETPLFTRGELATDLFWMHRNRALALHRDGKLNEAITQMRMALELHQTFPDIQIAPQVIATGNEAIKRWQEKNDNESPGHSLPSLESNRGQ